eukprot:6177767-Pleurochrysis_carterae.AAC.2
MNGAASRRKMLLISPNVLIAYCQQLEIAGMKRQFCHCLALPVGHRLTFCCYKYVAPSAVYE